MRKASRQTNGEYSTQSHVEQSGETHGNNMSVVCEIVITVKPLMYSLRDDIVNWRVMNVDAKHGKTDKYWNVQMCSPYQPCFKSGINDGVKHGKTGNYWDVETCNPYKIFFKPSLNCFDPIEYISWSKGNLVENVCSMDYQLNLMLNIDSACRDSIELVSDIRLTRLKIVSFGSSAASMDNHCESSLQLQSYHKIGLSRLCGVESSRWIGKGFYFNNVLDNAKTTYKCN